MQNDNQNTQQNTGMGNSNNNTNSNKDSTAAGRSQMNDSGSMGQDTPNTGNTDTDDEVEDTE